MITVALVLLTVIALVAIIGGIKMLTEGCVFSWYMGFHAMQAGFEIIGVVLAAIAQGVLEG